MLTVLKEQSNCKSLCCPVKGQNFAAGHSHGWLIAYGGVPLSYINQDVRY